ncbi:hypothetical protein D9M71_339620 [compost metagenome]
MNRVDLAGAAEFAGDANHLDLRSAGIRQVDDNAVTHGVCGVALEPVLDDIPGVGADRPPLNLYVHVDGVTAALLVVADHPVATFEVQL